MKKNIFILLLIISNIFFLLLYLDLSNKNYTLKTKTSVKESTDLTFGYPFLSKRIFTEKQNDILINFIPLRNEIKNYIGKQKAVISVYFEYLPSGTTIGVNDNLQIKLASLIKIPLVMAVYKEIEKGTIKEEDILTIKKEHIDSLFGQLWKKGEGEKLTVKEAIQLTLQESDNTAAHVLVSALPKYAMEDIFDALDLPKIKDDAFPLLSSKGYSSILRSLYLSSYLQKEHSNEILMLLTKTKFNDKLPSGVEPKIKVAHKIGVFNVTETDEQIYSDCGIIYYPQRPYMLCIMIKSDETKAREYISHLSKMVYGYITHVKGGQ